MTKRKRFSKAERQQVYDKFNGHCAYCGCEITLPQMQIDHKDCVDIYAGIYEADGKDINCIDNLFPACRSCNHYKSTMTVERFRQALEHMPNVLMRDNVTYRNAVRFRLINHPENAKVKFYFESEQEERQ